jgi:putative MATE family efflux protein
MARIDATQGPPSKVVRALAVPAAAQALLHTAYGFNDYLFVARLGDGSAIAALSACFGVTVVVFGVTEIVAIGVHTMVAQLTGAGATRRRLRLIEVGLVLTLLVGALITLTGLFASRPLAAALNLSPRALEHANAYLEVLLTGYPLMAMLRVLTSVYRGMGYTVAPVVMDAVTLSLNTLLNGMLVLGWFGVPSLGVAGAAHATILSCAPAVAVATAVLLRTARSSVDPYRKDPSFERTTALDDAREIVIVGIPASLIPLTYGLVYLAINRVAGVVGEEAQAGLGAALRGIEWFAFAICLGYHVAGSVAVGQCVGAGLPERARRLCWRTVFESCVVAEVVGLFMAIVPAPLMAIVVEDAAAIELGVLYLRCMGPVMFLVAIDMSLEGVLVGAGRTGLPMRISLVMNGLRIPVCAFMVFGLDHGVEGSLFSVGLAQAPPYVDEAWFGFLGITLTIIASAIGKAIWAWAAVARMDFERLSKERRERLQLG